MDVDFRISFQRFVFTRMHSTCHYAFDQSGFYVQKILPLEFPFTMLLLQTAQKRRWTHMIMWEKFSLCKQVSRRI